MFPFKSKATKVIKLGSKVRDIYTGLTGIAVGRTEYLYGCSRIIVEPTELKDGKVIDAHYFDEQRIEVLEENPAQVSKDSRPSATIPGGPQKDPSGKRAGE